jgi:hypothetical protein
VNRVLVVGPPRSGTTWVANVLARAASGGYLEEPDNHFRFAYAFRAKRRLDRREYPLLASTESSEEADDFAELWRSAFSPQLTGPVAEVRRLAANRLVRMAGPKRVSAVLARATGNAGLTAAAAMAVPERLDDGQALVVKSVYVPLCVEWIASRCEAGVVVVLRHPLNVVSSWIELGWLDPADRDPVSALEPAALDELATRFDAPPPAASRLARATWLIGVLTCALEDSLRRNPSWHRVVHEELCAAPHDAFPHLSGQLVLGWSPAGDALLDEMNRPGGGYETLRLAAELPDAWHRRLGDEQVQEIRGVLDRLPLPAWS